MNVVINMFLNLGESKPGEIELIRHQSFWCKVMLVIAFVTPPWMLFVKPLLLKRDFEQKKKERLKRGGDIELKTSPKFVSEDKKLLAVEAAKDVKQ